MRQWGAIRHPVAGEYVNNQVQETKKLGDVTEE
jgi:hypothetical protein